MTRAPPACWQAAYDGNLMTLDNLMSLNEAAAQRISMDAADADGRTPAHLAAANGHLGVLKVGVQLGTAAARCSMLHPPCPRTR